MKTYPRIDAQAVKKLENPTSGFGIEEGYKVSLNVYDLSQGLARQLSTTFLGKAIEGIWHTGVVVYGYEYYFGAGIQSAPVGTTPYGTPITETYSLLTHNCNNFSNEVAQFLVGTSIPDYILNLPNEVMSSPMGALMLPMIQQLETTLRAGAVPQAPQFRPTAVSNSIQTATAVKSTGAGNTQSTKSKDDEAKKSKIESTRHVDHQTEKKTVAPSSKAQEKPSDNGVTRDPLGDARSKVQEEISREFAAIMASGTLRASEAAALATRKVMQKYGHLNAARS
ncbi:hypothetical protein DH2020_024590 [Rehmannia glutinosa]|uniref:PPPDE domain-containing protein n=1 Tax=Rehmannia glutinosa TaxID=99300 RepID=A0ABR0W3X2_REHGL